MVASDERWVGCRWMVDGEYVRIRSVVDYSKSFTIRLALSRLFRQTQRSPEILYASDRAVILSVGRLELQSDPKPRREIRLPHKFHLRWYGSRRGRQVESQI